MPSNPPKVSLKDLMQRNAAFDKAQSAQAQQAAGPSWSPRAFVEEFAHPLQAGKDMLTGLEKAGQVINNATRGASTQPVEAVAQRLAPIAGKVSPAAEHGLQDVAGAAKSADQAIAKANPFGSQVAPALGNIALTTALAPELKAPEAANLAVRALAPIAGGAATGAATAAITPGASIGPGALFGAAGGAAASALGVGLSKIANSHAARKIIDTELAGLSKKPLADWPKELFSIAQGKGQRANAARKLIFAATSDDPTTEVQAALNGQLIKREATGSAIYDRAKEAMHNHTFNPSAARQQLETIAQQAHNDGRPGEEAAINAVIKRHLTPDASTSGTPALSAADLQYLNTLSPQARESALAQFRNYGVDTSGGNTEKPVQALFAGRKELQIPGKYAAKARDALKAELKQQAQAEGNSKAGRLLDQADHYWSTRVIPYQQGLIADAINKKTPEQAYSTLMKYVGSPKTAKELLPQLDARTRSAVRAGFVKQAADSARGEDGQVSRAAFVKYFKDRPALTDALMGGAHERQLLKGAERLLSTRIKPKVHTPGGGFGRYLQHRMLFDVLLGDGGAFGIGAGHTVLGGSLLAGFAGMHWLFDTSAGRRILMAASRVPADSPAAKNLAGRAVRAFQQYGPSATAATGAQAARGSNKPAIRLRQ